MKRFLTLLIALLMFATVFAFSAAADDGDVYYYVDQGAGDDRKNSGRTPDEALASFNRAITNAKMDGAKRVIIVIMAPYTVNGHVKMLEHKDFPIVMTSHDGKTDYRKENGAILHLGARNRFYLGGETTFENITFDFQATMLLGAQYYPITMGEGVVTVCSDTLGFDAVGVDDAGFHIAGGYIYPKGSFDVNRDSHITIKSGEFNRVFGGSYRWEDAETGGVTFTGTNHINIEGGHIKDLYGGSGKNHMSGSTVININGGKIDRLFTGGDEIRRILQDATVNLNGGEVGEVNINNVIGDVIVNLGDTKVSSMRAYFYSEKLHKEHSTWGKRTLNYDSSKYTAEQAEAFSNGFDKFVDVKNPDAESKKFEAFGKLIGTTPENVYFVADEGTGTGKSVTEPTNSLNKAFLELKESGGTIVVVGKCTVDRELTLRALNGKITLTSVYGGVDFQKENRAVLALRQNVTLGGELELCDITVAAENRNPIIYASGYPLTLGEGITSKVHELTMTYVSVYGGYKAKRDGAVTNVTINSGTWQNVYGGNVGGGKNLTSNIVINGGEIWGPVVAGSDGSHSGSGRITVNGGKIYQGIFSSRLDKGETSDMNTVITVNGGTVYATVAPDIESFGTYNGTFEVNLVGGEYGHLVSLNGGSDYTGNLTAKLNVDKSIDVNAKEEGDVTFKNPILQDGADPWLFYHNGLYHLTATIGDGGIGLATAANLSDFYNAEFRLFYTPPANDPWMKNHWSPEIHYYTDEQIGEGNGGWYCYFCCDGEGEGQHFRAMVIKCLDGDNFYGDWGHPLTGEVNVPMLVNAVDIPEVANTFHGGQTDVIIDGEVYAFFTTLIGYHTKGDGLKQVELIAKMPNPWTLQGPAGIISIPTYDWEKHGSIWDVRSEVNEGGTAVYGSDGSIFMVFSGSFYDGPEYKLGQIKYLGGDPLDINNWEKKDTPILDKSEEITGCGHASYSVDHEGNNWICYHAYVTGDTTMKGYGGGRRAFVEQYTADKNGVVIGNGSGHPAPLDTEYTMSINPMPLAEKISGFDKTDSFEAPDTEIRMTLNSLTATVNGAVKTLDAAPVIKNSRTMLPVRFVAENLGAEVLWDGATQTVSVKSADVTIEIVIGSSVAKVNGKQISLDSPAYIEPSNNRTYLPVRAVAENLGAIVSWDDATKTAILTK